MFNEEQKQALTQSQAEVVEELKSLLMLVASRAAPQLSTERAKEYLLHGVCRRLQIIRRCIERIYEIFPVTRTALLDLDERNDLEISLHAFVINVAGVQDNLAWVYVYQHGLLEKIRRGRRGVGLFLPSTQIYFPDEIRAYLDKPSTRAWQERYAKSYRDALAHRIPLYVPPANWTEADADHYRDVTTRIDAAIRDHDFDLVDALRKEQAGIGSICATFMHSFAEEDARPVYFHPQLVADARLVLEIVTLVMRHL